MSELIKSLPTAEKVKEKLKMFPHLLEQDKDFLITLHAKSIKIQTSKTSKNENSKWVGNLAYWCGLRTLSNQWKLLPESTKTEISSILHATKASLDELGRISANPPKIDFFKTYGLMLLLGVDVDSFCQSASAQIPEWNRWVIFRGLDYRLKIDANLLQILPTISFPQAENDHGFVDSVNHEFLSILKTRLRYDEITEVYGDKDDKIRFLKTEILYGVSQQYLHANRANKDLLRLSENMNKSIDTIKELVKSYK